MLTSIRTIVAVLCLISTLRTTNALTYLCPQAHFFDLQHCEACAANCKCSSMNGCDSCIDGYTMYQGSCIQCPQASGIYGTCSACCSKTTGTQLSCTDCQTVSNAYTFLYSGRCIVSPGCFQINSYGFCTQCFPQFYEQNNLCYSCHTSCSTCTDSTNCLTCASGYYWGVSHGGLCTSCPNGCATCDASSACYSCLSGFYLFQSNCLSCPTDCSSCSDGSTCTACSQGILVSNLCVLCTATTYQGSAGCVSCVAKNNFISCTQCADTYFLDSNGVCQLCSNFIPGAIRCSNQNLPTQCQDDSDPVLNNRYYLVGITCINNHKSCRKIGDIHGNCSICYDGYSIVDGGCATCPFTGCKTGNTSVISNICTCSDCIDGYYLLSGACVACSAANCAICPGDTCTSCMTGYYLNSGSCTSSVVSNCLTYDTSTTCSICNPSYYKGTDNLCYSCQLNCLKCSSRFTCTTCAAGYYLSSNSACNAMPSNCVALDNTFTCKLCQYGYYLYKGYCVACKIELGTLNQCQGLCPIDYYINSLVMQAFEKFIAIVMGFILLLIL